MLIAHYRRAGRDEHARKVAIAKQRRRRQADDELSGVGRAWSLFLAATVGYGYRTWQVGLWLLAFLIAGTVFFWVAYPEHITAAKRASETPDFQPFIYSLDLLIPVINLQQRAAWIPHGAAQWVAVVLTLAGWVLTTVAVAALSGLLKKD